MYDHRHGGPKSAIAAARNVVQHHGRISALQRQQLLDQRPATIWFTGLSGAGKSTLAYELEYQLHNMGYASVVLDGDNLRHGLNRDLGFTPRDRAENIRRTAEVAALMNEAGLIVFASLISPLRSDRVIARSVIGEENFFEVHVCTSIEICERRDPKGLYQKARAGMIPGFTGISAPYETPQAPSFQIDTGRQPLAESAQLTLDFLRTRGVLDD